MTALLATLLAAPSSLDAPIHTSTLSFASGLICGLNFIAALLFLRFYRRTADRLFLYFSGAFAIFGAGRIVFFCLNIPDDANTSLYIIRLAGFVLILIAIIDKNRKPARRLAP